MCSKTVKWQSFQILLLDKVLLYHQSDLSAFLMTFYK
jgi:hypothetical protein